VGSNDESEVNRRTMVNQFELRLSDTKSYVGAGIISGKISI
jgi:hypothetical protein